MPDPIKKPRQEAKRLRKSVKHRRQYAQSLRDTVARLRDQAFIDNAASNSEQVRFADGVDRLADHELSLARSEEAEARTLEARVTPTSAYSSPAMRERAEKAMKAIEGRMAIDRIRHLLERYGMTQAGSNDLSMQAVEQQLGIVHLDGKPQLGRRIDLAETAIYGAPRF